MSLRPAAAVTCSLLVLVASACGSSTTRAATTPSTAPAPAAAAGSGGGTSSGGLHTTSVAGVGTVLVDGSGRTVYLFEPDGRSKPTCTGACAAAWPPVAGPATAGAGARSSLLSAVSGPNGRQATYGGWPLYTFRGDTAAGQAHGQGKMAFGGYWYAVTANGTAAGAGPAAASPTTSASSGGGYGGGYGGY